MKKLTKMVTSKENQLEAYACRDCGSCDCYGGSTQQWVGVFSQISDLGSMSIAING